MNQAPTLSQTSGSPRRRRGLIIASLMLVLVLLSGGGYLVFTHGGHATPPSNTTIFYKVGDQVPVGPWIITINVYSSSGDRSYTPPAGNQLLIFPISQQNRTSQSAQAGGAADWSLHASTGGSSFSLITQSGYGTFPPQSIVAGDTATGNLVYEVPTSVHLFTLTFAPASGGSQASWDASI